MSDSNRGYRLAALGAVAALTFVALGAGAYFGSLYGPDHKQYEAVGSDETASESYHGVSESLPDIALIPDPVERAIANPQSHGGQDSVERDLAAQESMAAWAFYMAVFAGVTALVTFFGTILIWKQVSLTREAVKATGEATGAMLKANDIAERMGKAQVRAYISISKPQIDMVKPGVAKLVYDLKNFGATPAKDIQFYARAFQIDIVGVGRHHVRTLSDPQMRNPPDIGRDATETVEIEVPFAMSRDVRMLTFVCGAHYTDVFHDRQVEPAAHSITDFNNPIHVTANSGMMYLEKALLTFPEFVDSRTANDGNRH